MSTKKRAAVVVALIVMLSACSESAGDGPAVDPPAKAIDELTLHDGQFCPKRLPVAPQETYGFGTDDRATALPAFPPFDQAWVCAYQTRDIAPRGANGAWYEWARTGSPRQLAPEQVDSLAASFDELELIPGGDYACSADLGPRYLVSTVWERDLTGLVIDDYGCRSVRLTDDPFVTIPGEATQPGTVKGVLQPPDTLLAELGLGRDR